MFLLCAKQPWASHLKKYGYVKTSLPGVYQSDWPSWLPSVLLLSLNELSDAPHNVFVKCFASKQRQKRQAFEVLWPFLSRVKFPEPLVLFLETLWKHWFPGGNMKESTMTVEDFRQLGPHWRRLMLETLSVEDFLMRFKPADLLAQFQPADLLAHVKPEDIENYLTRLKQSPRPTTAKAKAKTKKRG